MSFTLHARAQAVVKVSIPHSDSTFYDVIQEQFHRIDSLRGTHRVPELEMADSLAQYIATTVEKYRETIINLPDTADYDLLYIAKSADKKLCLVSWDTRRGGTMIDFVTMAIYRTAKGIKGEMLVDPGDESDSDSYVHFDKIVILTRAGRDPVYLAQGFGQGSTSAPWQKIMAFTIRRDSLDNPKLFPRGGREIFVAFDTHYFGGKGQPARVPTIKIRDGGRTILVPQSDEDGSFLRKYQVLRFQNGIFSAH